ncbi:MAG: nicotinate-nicotinamide nucleotide adenylyltransferase [Rhodospirillales bacterium]|nr:nicotinate-nicotinamide nucleotide adenylyltransferase [Rhodospirillales bacterium]
MIFTPPTITDGARWAGRRVGLLGGSFNPPHQGHLHASMIALKTLRLDAVWWLVTPQNPLKDKSERSFAERFALCEAMPKDPRILVSDLEQRIGTNLTWQTIRALRHRFPRTDFVWVTGMDNALSMHSWHNWTDILGHVATAHVARPPAWGLIENCPLKMMDTQNHHYLENAAKVPLLPHNTYWLMQKKLLGVSSTQLRNQKEKTTG